MVQAREGTSRRLGVECMTTAPIPAHNSRAALAWSVAIALAATAFFTSGAAWGAVRIHLRGTARIDAHVARSQGKLVLSGVVTDDVGATAQGARVSFQLANSSAEPAGGVLPLASWSPEACGSEVAQAAALGPDRVTVATDRSARFCLRLAVPTGRYLAHLEVQSAGLVDGAKLDLPVDLAVAPVTLRFDHLDPRRPVLPLDEERLALDVTASTEDDGITSAAPNLPLEFSNETGKPLGRAVTDAEGRARLVVDGATLGTPGRGELRVTFAGNGAAGAATYATEVERRTAIVLDAPAAPGGQLPLASSSPERGVPLEVVARTSCASRGCPGSPTGTVEVDLAGGDATATLGAATLDQGRAEVLVRFARPERGPSQVPLVVRYVPDVPWFEPLAPLALVQPVKPPSGWDRAALGLASLAVVAWLVAGRLPRREAVDRSARAPRERVEARVEVLQVGAAGSGWRGRVVDAHEGTPVAGARVAIERASFDQVEARSVATSDATGGFFLGAADVLPGDRLVAESSLHARTAQPAPQPGELRVALVTRRRALLERLVTWAARRGRPFDARPEPTPRHVRNAARPGDAVAAWADAVEQAVYAGTAIDAQGEEEVDRLAPADASLPADTRRIREPPRRT